MIAHDFKPRRCRAPSEFDAGALRGATLVLIMLFVALAFVGAL